MPDDSHDQPTGASLAALVVRGSLVVGLFQGSIKVLGFLEKVVLGNVYGTSDPRYAAYVVAFEVLLVCSEVLRLSAIPSLVPMLEGVRRRSGDRAAARLTGRMATVAVLLVLACVTLPALFFGGPILRATFAREWLTDPARQGAVGTMIAFLRIVAGGAVFTAAGVCTYALLNSYRRFGLAALGDAAFKFLGLGAFLVVGFVLGMREHALFGLVGGIFGGCVGFVAVHVIALGRLGKLKGFRPGLGLRDPDLRATLLLFAPLVLSVLVFNARRILDKLFASGMELADYVAAQDFAFRFVETPYRLLIEPFAIVTLPYLAALALNKDRTEFRRSAIVSLRALLLIFVPASVGFYLLREPFIQVVLEHGRFDAASTYLTCGALRWYIPGLTLWALDVFIQRLYYATRETLRPTLFEIAAMAVYLLCCFAWRHTLRHEGLALAFTLSRVVKAGLLIAFLRSKLGRLDARAGIVFLGRLAVASAVLGLPVWGIVRMFNEPPEVRIWIEAEGERLVIARPDGTTTNGRTLSAEQGSTDTVRLDARTGGTAVLRFVVPETGTYRLWTRSRSEGGHRAMADVRFRDQYGMLIAPGAPLDWRREGEDLELTAGLQTLSIDVIEGAIDLDAVVLANAAGSLSTFEPAAVERPHVGRRGVRTLGRQRARPRRLLLLMLATALGLTLYLLALRLLRVAELRHARQLLSRRAGRGEPS